MITATPMASTVSASPYSAPPCAIARQTIYAVASSASGTVSWPRTSTITFNLSSFSSWSGLKHHGVSRTTKPAQSGRKKRRAGMVIKASLFGVGAPEALVIGVVALLVFGPKGLAEVARNLGKTLRAFQPTIREIQEVSREFKSTLEREIGLDDIPDQSNYNVNRTNPTSFPPTISSEQQPQTSVDPTADGAPSLNQAVSSEDLLTITEEQLKAAAAQQLQQPQQQGEVAVSGETSTESPIDETRPKSETTS